MLSSLNCPNCGAAAPGPDATRCDYCRSVLTAMACPACFGAMFVGMKFCPHCGGKGTRVEGDATLACPGCRGEMRAMHIGATSMFECGDCSSTWLDAESFAQLLSNREERGRLAATVTADRGSVVRTVGEKVRYRNCPRCKKVMNRENFGRRSGVVIDVCRGHGVWFERGELASVAAFVDAGGLERARVQEDERRRREREQLEKEFKESGRRVAHMPPTPSSTPADSLLMEALRKLLS